MRKATLPVVGSVVLLAAGLTAIPTSTALADDTTATFEVTAGALTVDAPATATVGTGAPGSVVNGALGPVAVTDARASADGSWVASVTATNFVTGASTPSEVTLATEIDYWSGPVTASTGNGTLAPGQVNAAAKVPLDTTTPLTALTHAGGTGNNTATWNPTLSVRVPLDSQAGTYEGTVTHSVA
jgi:hypothetical protein